MGRDDSEGPASTELDLKLPTDIAVRHAEESFESKETLPRVELPTDAAKIAAPPGDPAPPFNPADFPTPRPRIDRSTEHVAVPAYAAPRRRQGSPLLWALLGAGIALAAAAALYFVALR